MYFCLYKISLQTEKEQLRAKVKALSAENDTVRWTPWVPGS